MCQRVHVRWLLCLSLAVTLAFRTTASATHATSSGGPSLFANETLVTPGEAMAAASAPFKAVERVAVIELSFATRPFPFSNAQVQSAMATLNTYIQEVSYGKR